MHSLTTSSSPGNPVNLPAPDSHRVFLFEVGHFKLGVPLEHVRYVTSMPTGFAGNGVAAEDHFVFQDTPLTYVSLWDELGVKSKYLEYDDLQSMLPLRLKDHVNWMDALESSIVTGKAFEKARDPHQCAFGKWYYGYQARDPRLSLLLRQFEEPHAMIHALADRLLRLTETGRTGEAKRAFDEAKSTTLPALTRLFDATQTRLAEMQKRIVLVLTDGNDHRALGADNTHGIVAAPPEQMAQAARRPLGLTTCAASKLVILEDHGVVPMLNWQQLRTGGVNREPVSP